MFTLPSQYTGPAGDSCNTVSAGAQMALGTRGGGGGGYTSLPTPSRAQPRPRSFHGARHSTRACAVVSSPYTHSKKIACTRTTGTDVFLFLLLCLKSEQYNEKHSNVK